MAPRLGSPSPPAGAMPAWQWDKPSTAAALSVLLRSGVRSRAARFVDCEFAAIDWDGLREASGSWSAAERLLVRVAEGLFHTRRPVNLRELLVTLDGGDFEQVTRAIRILRGSRRGILG